MRDRFRILPIILAVLVCVSSGSVVAQPEPDKRKVRTVSIPISIFTKTEIEQGQTEELLQVDRLIVKENNQEQTILSIRSRSDVPMSLAILVQDDLASDFNLQLKDIKRFVESLPRGTRVMVAYLRGGSLDIRQKFTEDLTRAAQSFRIVTSDPSAAPRSPYDGVLDTLKRFDALPTGRRAILMISDGLDLTNGVLGSSPGQNTTVRAAIQSAQRRSVAVFAIFGNTTTDTGSSIASLNGQGSLQAIADETGGRAFIQGTRTPINFEPILKQLNLLIGRQFLLSYLSPNMKRGYYKVEVTSTSPEVKIEHPKGYFYR
ncbi:MAG: VWA domain-containing protein [Pyrinomonadaceae bacterium]